jgi:hypothetical protein
MGYRPGSPRQHLRLTTTWWCARRRPYDTLHSHYTTARGLGDANRILERCFVGACKLDSWLGLGHDRAPHPGHAYVVARPEPVCGTRRSAADICMQRLLDPTADAYGPRPMNVRCGIRPPATSPAATADAVGVSL